jgi:hypothetical protein
MKEKVVSILNQLSKEINALYGFVTIRGDNYGDPAINSGPCGAFAYAFFHIWNRVFSEKVHFVFVMDRNPDECWHVVIRLPNGSLFDGGYGVHEEKQYNLQRFHMEDMLHLDLKLLEERSYGLERDYPLYCPSFSLATITSMIEKSIEEIKIIGL